MPRRSNVFGAQIAVPILTSTLLGLLAQAAWLAMATLLRPVDGSGRA